MAAATSFTSASPIGTAKAQPTITIPRHVLELWRFCSRDEGRYNLAVIEVTCTATGLCTAVATDGHRLTKVEWTDKDGTAGTVHIPWSHAKTAAKAMGRKETFARVTKGHVIAGDLGLLIPEFESQFPDWTQVVPRPIDCDSQSHAYGINARYLGDCGDYLHACGEGPGMTFIGIKDEGLGPTLWERKCIDTDTTVVFVIMPIRL